MKIALDYDKTYNLDREFWNAFIDLAADFGGIDVRIVTARSPTTDKLSYKQMPANIPVIYCDGVAKKFACRWFANWNPDIWIDDKPEGVGQNSTATEEILEAWRGSPEYTA